MLTYADDFVATGAEGLRNSLAYVFADVTRGNEGSRQGAERTYADVCARMLTYADVC
jgi:hypothetical protein